MVTTSPRTRRREKNLARILELAMSQVADKGLEALSIHKLAAALDYTPGALYRYFPSKDALILALIAEVIASLREELAAASGDTPLDRIRALCDVWGRIARQSPARFGLISMCFAAPSAILSTDEAAAEGVQAMMAALTPLVSAFTSASSEGLLLPGDPTERALVLFAGLNGVLMLRKQAARAPEILDLERLARTYVDTLLSGWAHPLSRPSLRPQSSSPTRSTP